MPVAEKKLDPVLLRKYPLILLEKETSTRRYIDSFFGEGTLSPSIELATSDLLIEFARRGIGITCVVEDFAKDDLASGRLCRVELRHELPPRRFMLAHLKNLPLPAAASHIIREILSDLGGESNDQKNET